MDLQVKDGFYILTIDKAVVVLSKAEFVHGLRRGKWWRRRQALAPREATMQEHADQEREQLVTRTQRTSKK